jgi:hypothetical protein
MADGRQTVRHHRQTRDAKRHRAYRRVIVQRHLDAFVGILVVHVMDDVHRIHIHLGQPFHHPLELAGDIVKVEIVALDRFNLWPDLLAGEFVAPAVDGVKEALGEVRARAEKLHLFAHEHWRNATGDRAIVTPRDAHQRVVFELQCAGVNGDR